MPKKVKTKRVIFDTLIFQMRKRYVDLLREIALFYMFFQHAVLALLKASENQGIIFFLYELVPICPALFLFVAGFSITLSYSNKKKPKTAFSKHLIKRGIILIIFSSLLFFIEYGFQLPDIFFSSGILNTIGLMIIISAVIMLIPRSKITTLVITTILIVSTYLLEKNKIFFIPFNYGFEPITPTIIFGFIGLFVGMILNKTNNNKNREKLIILTIGIIGLIIFSIYSIKYGLFKIFFSNTGRYTVERAFSENLLPQNILKSGSLNTTVYAYVWNYNIECFFASLASVFILFSTAYFMEDICLKYLPKYSFLAGRNAFFNYFYHLAVIALFVVIFGYNKFSTNLLLIFLGLLFITSYIFPYILQNLKNKKEI